MGVMSPGFQRQKAKSTYGNPWAKMVGIVLAEHSVADGESSWYAGPTYDVLTVDDLNILYDVKACAGSSGSNDVMFQRYKVSNPAIVSKVYNATTGYDALPPLSDLDGARVLVEFLNINDQATEPYISNCFAYSQMPKNKIPNAKIAAGVVSDVTSGKIDQLSDQIASRGALNDLLTSNSQAGVIWNARLKYIHNDNEELTYPTPPMANTEEKKGLWEASFETAWSAGFQNTYWDGDIDASNDGAITTEFDNSWLMDNGNDDSSLSVLRDGWLKGWKQGDIDAKTELSVNPPQVSVADNSGAVLKGDNEAGEPADLDIDEWDQVAAKGNMAVWYLEKKGCRIVIDKDGGYTIDTRTSQSPIRIQGGDGGVTIASNGVIVEMGKGYNEAVKVTAQSIILGGNTARAVLGDAMMNVFNGHDHDETGIKTAPPNQLMNSDEILSDVVVLA